MKKFFTFIVLGLFSATSWAAVSITISPNNVDFGSQSIKGKNHVEGSVTFNVTYSGLQPYCGVYFDDVEMPENDAAFWIEGTNTAGYIYGGDAYNPAEGQGLTLNYYAEKAGTYTGKIRFYSYTDADWTVESQSVYMTMKLVVTSDADVPTTTPFERINSTADLKDGDIIVFVSESAGAVGGPLDGTYLPAVTEGVKIDKTNGKADVPEAAQQFTAKKYSGNWQFTTTDTGKRLHLDVSGKGAFTYADTQAGTILANWGVAITNGEAIVSKPDEDQSFPVEFNSDRFKPYKTSAGTAIALYKKAGEAQQVESKLEVEDIVFGNVELDEKKEVTVNYTADHLTDDIVWAIEGTDAALFDVTDNGDRESGTLTISYKGTGTKTGTPNAKLSYLTQDVNLDPMEGSKTISINLIAATVKLTKIEFSNAPTTIDQGQSIDMSQYVVYTPNDAADKSLEWSVDNTYQGTVDAKGVLTAKQVTGTIVVTATSKRVPSVSASHTLTITKPTITDFTLSKTEVMLNVGGKEQLSITAFVPSYASEKATYASQNKDIATVSNAGLITAKAIGETTVTATIGEVVKSCKVTVVAVSVESIAFANDEANVTLGASLQLNPTVTPAQAASEYTISYSSKNEAVATVSASGLVKGVSEGDAVITATISDKSAQITIHVVTAATFAKVTDASALAENDTIILATIYEGNGVIAGARDGKKLKVLTSDVTVTASEAYADEACRMVLGKEKNKEGFTLTIVGGKTIAVASSGNDIVDANTTNCKFWEFVDDEGKGIYVHNLGNTNAYFKYHASNAAVKPYKANTAGAVYVYVYVRKYVKPDPTGVEEVQSDNEQGTKVLRNGQLYIMYNGTMYDVMGRMME